MNYFTFWGDLLRVFRKNHVIWLKTTFWLISFGFIAEISSAQTPLKFQNFTQRDGLASNYVMSICEDHQGFMWVGTENGLNRFDGRRFLAFRFDPADQQTLDDNWIRVIKEDSRQTLWIGTEKGLNRLDRTTGKIERIPLYKKGQQVLDLVKGLYEGPTGTLWVVTGKQGLFRLNRTKNQAEHFYHDQVFVNTSESLRVFNLVYATEKELWITTSGGIGRLEKASKKMTMYHFPGQVGLYEGAYDLMPGLSTKDGQIYAALEDKIYTLNTKEAEPQVVAFEVESSTSKLSQPFTRSLLMDADGVLSVPSLKNLTLIDPQTGRQQLIRGVRQKGEDLFSDFVHTHHVDRQGNYWIGTAGSGLYMGRQQQEVFSLIGNNPANSNSIAKGQVRSILEDDQRNLWIGILNFGIEQFTYTEGNSLRKVKSITADPTQNDTLASNRIIKLIEGANNSIWIASNDQGLIRMNPATHQLQNYIHIPGDLSSISANRIWAITQDSQGYIWAGTWQDGLNRLDPATGQSLLYRHDPNDHTTLGSNNVRFLLPGSKGNLWIGTERGLNSFDPISGQFQRFEHDDDNPNSLSHNMVWTIYQDSKGMLWIGTNIGLNRFDPENQTFQRYYEKDGLPDNTVYGILEDETGVLWISTENGLARQLPAGSKTSFLPLGLQDGLPTVSFLPKAYLKSNLTGQLYFGSTDGMLVVRPKLLVLDSVRPKLVIHTLTQTNPQEGAVSAISDHFIDQKRDKIQLRYPYRSVSVSISDMNSLSQQNHRYEYQLVGLNNKWAPFDDDLQINFANLAPRTYQFRARGVSVENVVSKEVSLFELEVFPPWWRSRWAYSGYILLTLAIIYALYRFQLHRQLERQEAENLRALDALKSELYANITHEFRTPLTIILGMIEQMERDPKRWLKEGAQMVRKNGSNLLDLINQMLALQKLESGSLTLHLQFGDLVPFLKAIAKQFQVIANSKKQSLAFQTSEPSIGMAFDQEKMLRIVSNLLSNAIKYTPEKGQITFEVSVLSTEDKQIAPQLLLSVSDSGPGMREEELPLIFDRFYRATTNDQKLEIGTGIGLSLVQELVKLLDGTIEVKSELGTGTSFHIFLPITTEPTTNGQFQTIEIPQPILVPQEPMLIDKPSSLELPIALIVEDNPDVAQYLQICLQNEYKVLQAVNGQIGIDKALEVIPDIIISDVMMPEKDGFELCENLKEDTKTSHIPIILLTSKADVASRIVGLRQGADDYLAKPFHEEELLVRMQNLLNIRRKLQERYEDLYNKPLSTVAESSTDKEDTFIQNLKEVFDENMADLQFDLDGLSQALFISRSQLGRKVKALTGQSPAVFLRSLRLQKGRYLLLTSKLSVKEVAYEVGFSDPSYFSRSYSEQYGENPSITGSF